MGALLGHPPVHRQGPEQRQEHYEERGEGRERTCGQRRDARNVSQGREVVYPCKAHHLPPGVLLASALLGLRTWHVLDYLREQPALESIGRGFRQDFGPRHYASPEARRQRQGRVRQDPHSGTRQTSFFSACEVSCRVRAERVKPYTSSARPASDSPRGPLREGPCGSPAPRRHPGARRLLGIVLSPGGIRLACAIVNVLDRLIHRCAYRGCMKSPQTRASRLVMRRI